MPARRKAPPRLPRIDRDESQAVHEDENAHLWAVSYADFLMAVLSFFILFYSADSPKKKAFIMNLTKDFSNQNSLGGDGTAAGTGTGNGVGPGPGTGNGAKAGTGVIEETKPARIPAGFAESLRNLDISSEAQNDVLILNFSDDFFKPGKFEITSDKVAEVKDVLMKIKPFENKVNLFFEGHADDQAFKPNRHSLLKDNFVLSSLRASSALFLAKQLGFSDKNLFIQAAGSNLRNSRTLSIRIEPREDKL